MSEELLSCLPEQHKQTEVNRPNQALHRPVRLAMRSTLARSARALCKALAITRYIFKPPRKGHFQVTGGTRYRYDEIREVRLTTVELIVEEKPWKQHDAKLVRVQVGFSEIQLRDRLKTAGGKWHPEEKLWYVPYGAVRGTELEERIMTEDRKGKRRS